MRIGIFGDVHGHLVELEKTLALLEHLNVDQIICMGDLVDKGQHSNAVIDQMREREIICIQGNHDAKAQFMWLSHHDEPLTGTSLDYLIDLPETLSFVWEDVTVFLCHANPWLDTSIYVFPTRPLALFREVIEAVEETILIMGHTHHPMWVKIDAKTLVNPGSIYGNRDRVERTCGVLTLPDCIFELYDIDSGCQLALPVMCPDDYQ
jgi:putative phosphoesterase